ncbi:ATP-binding cassette domain-containing protein [Peribacillus saganii]|uniref:ATP-binding cassette domain-containing protein n=1 Tax=Peribacillus saganii TaxID=2303992 RepID=A0A372LLD0_9BACI|nr:AAA family ATPase [Peribacillus saganii]RFU67667.1 ATP-binding cassette domain-containing protein [Peribacillus saganii]
MSLKKITIQRERIPNTDEYPFSIPSIRSFQEMEIINNVTFFVGENGSGKSTLLEAIAEKCGFNTAGGGRNNYYNLHASESELGYYITLSWLPKITNGFFLRAESFYHFATHLEEIDDDTGFTNYGGRSLHHQSHGESFLALFLNRFKGRGIYLLDEPEAALSPQRQLAFLRILHDLASKDESQFIIATHSPILLGYPNATIYNFDEGEISEVQYEMTNHYQIMKGFLNRRDQYLKELFLEEDD